MSKAMQHGVDQRAGVLAGAAVDHHARGLVDRDDIGVFIQHIERQILGRRPQRSQFGWLNVDALGALQQERTLFGRAVDQHAPLVDPILQAAPGCIAAGVRAGT